MFQPIPGALKPKKFLEILTIVEKEFKDVKGKK